MVNCIGKEDVAICLCPREFAGEFCSEHLKYSSFKINKQFRQAVNIGGFVETVLFSNGLVVVGFGRRAQMGFYNLIGNKTISWKKRITFSHFVGLIVFSPTAKSFLIFFKLKRYAADIDVEHCNGRIYYTDIRIFKKKVYSILSFMDDGKNIYVCLRSGNFYGVYRVEYINFQFRHRQSVCASKQQNIKRIALFHLSVDHLYYRIVDVNAKSKYYGTRILKVLHRDYEQHLVVYYARGKLIIDCVCDFNLLCLTMERDLLEKKERKFISFVSLQSSIAFDTMFIFAATGLKIRAVALPFVLLTESQNVHILRFFENNDGL